MEVIDHQTARGERQRKAADKTAAHSRLLSD
jgi:hypothetical protein